MSKAKKKNAVTKVANALDISIINSRNAPPKPDTGNEEGGKASKLAKKIGKGALSLISNNCAAEQSYPKEFEKLKKNVASISSANGNKRDDMGLNSSQMKTMLKKLQIGGFGERLFIKLHKILVTMRQKMYCEEWLYKFL